MTVRADGWANIRNCPGTAGSSDYWWCGGRTATACQTGIDASTFDINGGSLQTILTELNTVSSTSLTTTSTSSTTASITSSPASIIGSPPITITATATAAVAVANGGSNKSSNTSVAIGAGVGIPLGIAALGFLGFLIWREQKLRKQRRGDKVVAKPTQQSSPSELSGHVVESELVAPAPVHEMYTKPGHVECAKSV